jgi:hypothetical protein
MTYRMNENVTFTELDDAESVLLHLKTRRYFSLNETGTLIWQQLRQGKEVDEIAALLEQQYELDTPSAFARAYVLASAESRARAAHLGAARS